MNSTRKRELASARSLFAWEEVKERRLPPAREGWGVVAPMFCAVAGRR
nr:MAG TPA: hypothetical protein [Caudoviricetes sp.]